jgi:hypothetical protein
MRLRRILIAFILLDGLVFAGMTVAGATIDFPSYGEIMAAASQIEIPRGPVRGTSPIEGVYKMSCASSTCSVVLLDREYGPSAMMTVKNHETGYACSVATLLVRSGDALVPKDEGQSGISEIGVSRPGFIDVKVEEGLCSGMAANGSYSRT